MEGEALLASAQVSMNDDGHDAPRPSMRRVKLYKLTPQGMWDDKGTGHVAVEYLLKPKAMGLVVVSEKDFRILMVHRICEASIYQRQGEDTIITWMDPDVGTDVALSFQEEEGCTAIWDTIQRIQQGTLDPSMFMQSPSPTEQPGGDGDGEDGALGNENAAAAAAAAAADVAAADLSDRDAGGAGGKLGGGSDGELQRLPSGSSLGPNSPGDGTRLPWPSFRSLPDIRKALVDIPHPQKDQMAKWVRSERGWLPRLLEVFREAEDIEDSESLKELYYVMRALIMLNDVHLLDELLNERNFWHVIGCLEYDPDLYPKKAEHRHFLQDVAKFKEVVEVPNEHVRQQIHSTFRIGYIKDAVLPRSIDENTFAALHSVMIYNYLDIVQALQESPHYFKSLFRKLHDGDANSDAWCMLMNFVQEITTLTSYPQFHRGDLLQIFLEQGLLTVMAKALGSRNGLAKSRAMDVLFMMVQHDAPLMRARLTQPPNTMLGMLFEQVLSGEINGIPEQALETLKLLLDPENMDQGMEKNECLETFYDRYMPRLIHVITHAGKALAAAASATMPPSDDVGGAAPADSGEVVPSEAAADGKSTDAAAVAGEKDGSGSGASAEATTPSAEAAEDNGVIKQPTDAAAAAGAAHKEPAAAATLTPAAAAAAASEAAGNVDSPGTSDTAGVGSDSGDGAENGASNGGAARLPASNFEPAEDSAEGGGAKKVVQAAGSEGAGAVHGEDVPPPFVLGLVLELMQFCVVHHTFRIKYFVLRHNIVQKVMYLMYSPKRWLVVAALRFLRTCIGLKDDFYNRYLTRHFAFDLPIQIFLDNGEKDNLLNSTFLELIDFVTKQSVRPIVQLLVDKYWDKFQHITYVNTFKALKERYDLIKNPAYAAEVSDRSMSELTPRSRRDERDMDQDQEAYFAEDDEDGDGEDGRGEAATAHELMPLPGSSGDAGARGGSGYGGDPGRQAAVAMYVPSPFADADGGDGGQGTSLGCKGGSRSDHQWDRSGSMGAFRSLVGYDDDDDDEDDDEDAEELDFDEVGRAAAMLGASASAAAGAPASGKDAESLHGQNASSHLSMFERSDPMACSSKTSTPRRGSNNSGAGASPGAGAPLRSLRFPSAITSVGHDGDHGGGGGDEREPERESQSSHAAPLAAQQQQQRHESEEGALDEDQDGLGSSFAFASLSAPGAAGRHSRGSSWAGSVGESPKRSRDKERGGGTGADVGVWSASAEVPAEDGTTPSPSKRSRQGELPEDADAARGDNVGKPPDVNCVPTNQQEGAEPRGAA